MRKLKIGIVGLASHFESGDHRANEILGGIKDFAQEFGMLPVMASQLVYEPAEAISACDELNDSDIDALIIVDITWVADSLKYLFINELKVPVVFWAIPYTETFSIACVQHFCSILKSHGLTYSYVYGVPSAHLMKKIRVSAVAGNVLKKVKKMRIALMGPRQTWRVAGPQDMTDEEWNFSRKFGTTLIHLDMDEVFKRVKNISDTEAEKALELLASHTGKASFGQDKLLFFAKVYLATKNILEANRLTAIAAECYPMFGGLMNLVSSWLADEGFVIDTEGDIGHTLVELILNTCAGGGATILGETGSIRDDEDYLMLAHEGSTALTFSETIEQVEISPLGDEGCFVGFPAKAMDQVTLSSIVCSNGQYKMLIAKGKTLNVSYDEWVDAGSKMIAKLRFNKKPSEFVDSMMRAGLDHHFVIKEGDYTQELSMICDYLNIEKVLI